MKQYANKRIAVRKLLTWADIQPSIFYYKKSGGLKGKKPTTHSINHRGQLFENAVVIKEIEQTLAQEFCCYGYHTVTDELKDHGWIINHKKVNKAHEGKQSALWRPDKSKTIQAKLYPVQKSKSRASIAIFIDGY